MSGRGGNRLGRARARAALVLLAVALLALAASGCGGGSDNGDVTLTVASRNTPEETVLGQIYAQALRSAGYEVNVKTLSDSEFPEGPIEKIESGRISGYPEHFKPMLLKLFGIDNPPTDPEEAYRLAKERLAKEGATAFAPTPYSLSRPVGMLRKTAEENDLEGMSDLKGVSEVMTLLGPTDCHISGVDCLGGMERRYGITFETISYTYTPKQISERYKQLEKGSYDAAIVNSTEGRLATEGDKFVALYDDENRFPADNVIFVTSPKVVDEAGSDFEETILAAQEGLTLPVMQQLDAEVELEGKHPADVAAGYLEQGDSTE
jgi:osmoprotectant transport system substrate-binding protein